MNCHLKSTVMLVVILMMLGFKLVKSLLQYTNDAGVRLADVRV